jgi:hypothetical protein
MNKDTIAMRGRIVDWFDALDPGRLRFHNALRATMAMFVTWIIVYLITQEIGWYFLGIGIFALLSSFICDLVINQVPLDSRAIALPLVFIPMALAVFIVALLDRDPLLTAVAIILTFYLAYFSRRFGVIPFLLGFTAVTVFYVSFLLSIDQAVMDSLVFTIGVAVSVNFLFWFILMPSRPGMAFVRGVKSFNRRCHRILLAAKQTFDEGNMDAKKKKSFDRDLRRLTESRRVIEIQMNDILNTYPSLSSLFELMKMDLFSDERATRLLVNDIEDLSLKGYSPPKEVRKALSDLLGALAGWVESPTSEDRRKDISDRLEILKDLIHTYESDQSSNAWIVGLGIFYLDGRMLMESVTRFMVNFNEVSIKVRERKEKKTRIIPQKKPRSPLPMATIFGRWNISIPSLMAIQALTAAFIALGIAELIGLSSIIQSFWFALLTVSGSLGATKAKSLSRVIGTALGIGVGLTLGFVAGGISFISVGFILILFFIMVFTRTLSLNWFILCIVSISVVSMAMLGADFVEVAKLLMVSCLIGVGAALLATTILFPIRVRQRYIHALSGYLATADRYLRSFNEHVGAGNSTAKIDGSSELDQKQEVLEASSKENLYEANPFSSVDRESSYDMTTALQTLHSALVGLRHKQLEGMIDESRLEFINTLIGVISRNIATTCNVLESKVVHGSDVIFDDGKDIMHALEGQEIKWSADGGVTLFRSYLKDLLQVHGIILELGQGIVKERM